jgi:Mlc titration factor MtfA (ptsG expression regulator)
MWRFFQQRRRQEILSQPFPESFREILRQNIGYVRRLDAAQRSKHEQLVRVFLAEKRFEGCGGLELTDEMRVTIAGAACVLLLGLDHDMYRQVDVILVYPSAVYRPARRAGFFEVALSPLEPTEPLLGEAHLHGPVIVAWDAARRDCRNAQDGHNVVFHELAHKLDMLDGGVDGTPPLRGSDSLKRWAEVCSRAFLELRERTSRGEATFMDAYGATSEAEFFAVATETFFEKPEQLLADQADLYAVLREFYQQDPAAMHGDAA